MNMNEFLDNHAPYRKLKEFELTLKIKPWITLAIQK